MSERDLIIIADTDKAGHLYAIRSGLARGTYRVATRNVQLLGLHAPGYRLEFLPGYSLEEFSARTLTHYRQCGFEMSMEDHHEPIG